jgi:hypothetical protein
MSPRLVELSPLTEHECRSVIDEGPMPKRPGGVAQPKRFFQGPLRLVQPTGRHQRIREYCPNLDRHPGGRRFRRIARWRVLAKSTDSGGEWTPPQSAHASQKRARFRRGDRSVYLGPKRLDPVRRLQPRHSGIAHGRRRPRQTGRLRYDGRRRRRWTNPTPLEIIELRCNFRNDLRRWRTSQDLAVETPRTNPSTTSA